MNGNEPADQGTERRRVFIIDDHGIVRQGLTLFINKQSDLVVCGEAEDALSAMQAIPGANPEVVIVDISLKDSDGLELIKGIKAHWPHLPILVLTMHDESLYGELALRAGASGYIMKQEAIDRVLAGIRRVIGGGFYLSESLTEWMLGNQVRHHEAASPVQRLTPREQEVFHLIGHWRSTAQIARELRLSIKTVEYYREQIKKKLKLSNAIELVQYATQCFSHERMAPKTAGAGALAERPPEEQARGMDEEGVPVGPKAEC